MQNVGMRVLLAEDEKSIADLYKILLESNGHEVVHAVDGEQCMKLFKTESRGFDLVILDYRMPKVDGLQVANQIEKIKPKQAMIIVTAYVDVLINDIVSKLDRNVVCVQKPVDPILFTKIAEAEAGKSGAKVAAAAD